MQILIGIETIIQQHILKHSVGDCGHCGLPAGEDTVPQQEHHTIPNPVAHENK